MKYQEVFDRLLKYVCVNPGSLFEDDIKTLQEAIDKAKKYDEKETPKEVIYTKGSGDFTKNHPNPYDTYRCPKCNAYLSNKSTNFNYCPYCGKRIKKRKKDDTR